MKSSIPTATAPTATPDFSRIVLIKAINSKVECCWLVVDFAKASN
jgi:hypothetical protein